MLTWVGVRQQRAHRQQDLRDGQGGAPIVLQNIEADGPIAVYVAVVNSSFEDDLRSDRTGHVTAVPGAVGYSRSLRPTYFGRLERIIRREAYIQVKKPPPRMVIPPGP